MTKLGPNKEPKLSNNLSDITRMTPNKPAQTNALSRRGVKCGGRQSASLDHQVANAKLNMGTGFVPNSLKTSIEALSAVCSV
eukprot:2029877-Amphidinium_carterae.1